MPETIDQTGPATALGAAFHAAGYKTVAERLDEIMVAAVETGHGIATPSMTVFIDALRADDEAATLIWELMSEVRTTVVRRFFESVLFRTRQSQAAFAAAAEPPAAAGPPAPAGEDVVTARHNAGPPLAPIGRYQPTTALIDLARKTSWLDRFIVNGRAIGDLRPGEALTAETKRKCEARFIELLTSGISAAGKNRIRDHIEPDEADRLWLIAHRETQE